MSEFEEYKNTGILGAYQPKRVCSRLYGNGKLLPIFWDARIQHKNECTEMTRQMIVGERTFTIRSFFPKDGKTITDSMLKLIDSDLTKIQK